MTTLLVATRGLHYLGCWLLAGSLGFRLFVLRADEAEESGFCQRGAWIGFALAVVSGMFWFWIEMASMSGETLWEALQADIGCAVLRDTQFGHVWAIRGGLAVMLAMAVWWSGRPSRRHPHWTAGDTGPYPSSLNPRQGVKSARGSLVLAWIASSAFLGTLCGVGHAAAVDSHLYPLAFDAVHLVASGMWPGALFPFLSFLFIVRRSPEQMKLLAAVTRRFSRLSLFVVAFLGLSGVVNACVLLGRFDDLWKTSYGATLSIKLLLFAGMLVFAAVNLLYITPRLTAEYETEASLYRMLWRNVGAEAFLALGVVAAVALLGITAPPH